MWADHLWPWTGGTGQDVLISIGMTRALDGIAAGAPADTPSTGTCRHPWAIAAPELALPPSLHRSVMLAR
ncbi:hypothetical protein EBE87_01105 [Pseudoroseomonas wenyumeiae]|uniref:Uncharacterized protein n=2 Tax=Teichococcus wenyumeiae TaxID=2478470 RepID=A0A3A9JSV6_9PROT|nr:hypothetical protein D6Z83_21845 [Pseudoroseomonas wenyumeiae]RMI27009.1 hypothetical protein EBE87_01105 [Pseudoroseomonas wenyumeiae]